MTLREFLEYGVSKLSAGPHPDRARLDAETLLLHHIGKNKAWRLAHANDIYAGCSAIGYAAMLERRRAGEPLQYITGECEFYGLPFRVTPDVLIPRPETEHLVEKALSLAAQLPANQISPARILDVGTGSGAIAVALAHKLPNAQITATDISAPALALAAENAACNSVAGRICFLQGDLLAPVAGETFDIIVSNPPYVSAADRPTLAVEVRDFEPSLALFAGPDGLDIYRRLIPAAFNALTPGGYIVLEIGYGQSTAIEALLSATGFIDLESTLDLQQIPRVLSAGRP
jgi:release factor glutamine methyltransferase